MKTEQLNGRDIGKLYYNYNIVYHPKKKIYFNARESQIEYIFRDTNFEYLFYAWERSKEFDSYHAHIMINHPNIDVLKLYENINGYKEIDLSNRKALVKTKKSCTNMKLNSNNCEFVDVYHNVQRLTMYGTIGKLYIEPVIDIISSARYITKNTSRGLNFKYIPGNII